ncbi:MAG TPA: chaperone modulator CbpM [Stellaceae bacterium]|nr:chaperone modulator CbpM [Stellaceae bacterium]
MIGADDLLGRVAGLERAELVRWIENRWIVPDERGGGWVFREVDIARVELILDIRRQFAVDDEAMPLILGLIDQVYSLRREMRRLCEALERQPADIRAAISRALAPGGGR